MQSLRNTFIGSRFPSAIINLMNRWMFHVNPSDDHRRSSLFHLIWYLHKFRSELMLMNGCSRKGQRNCKLVRCTWHLQPRLIVHVGGSSNPLEHTFESDSNCIWLNGAVSPTRLQCRCRWPIFVCLTFQAARTNLGYDEVCRPRSPIQSRESWTFQHFLFRFEPKPSNWSHSSRLCLVTFCANKSIS